MKNLIFAISLIFSINLCAQNEIMNKNVFVRVYDLQGKKICKGEIFSTTEATLIINREGKSKEIPLASIGYIKTKHSAGNNFLVGSIIGASSFAIIGFATDDGTFLTTGQVVGGSAFIGAVLGGLIGGVTAPSKKSKTYEINGNKVKWKAFTEKKI